MKTRPKKTRPTSRYLTMRDGVRIAIDVYLPAAVAGGARVPAVIHQTRYFRRLQWGLLARAVGLPELTDIMADKRAALIAAGYAWIDVDARGSGASSGSQPSPWWHDEVADGAEVVDWIVAQPWCDGAVGTTGVSYSGTTAEMLLVNRHPAVKAAIPRFSLFDVYTDVAFPGGLHLDWFTGVWSRMNRFLDANTFPQALSLLARINLSAVRHDLDVRPPWPALLELLDRDAVERFMAACVAGIAGGVSPTDDDPHGVQLAASIAGHAANFDVHAAALGMNHRDDRGLSSLDPDATIDVFSPHSYLRDIDGSGAAIYSYSGWLDGGYTHSAVKRHLNLSGAGHRLILGPWDHGGRQHISPMARGRSRFDHVGEVVGFFEHHLRGARDGGHDGDPVRYFTMGAERWQSAPSWPPPHVRPLPWYFDAGCALTPQAPRGEGRDAYRIDSAAGTGTRSRWRSLIGLATPLSYGDRAVADRRLLCYTSAPLPDDLEVTGHPVAYLTVTSSATDGGFFVYLEDVAPSGRVSYVTEGQLRALHRAVLDRDAVPYRDVVPQHSHRAADARPLVPGEPAELAIALQPTSYLFAAGHQIRVAIAGADRDNFRTVPGSEGAELSVLRGGPRASRIELPVASN